MTTPVHSRGEPVEFPARRNPENATTPSPSSAASNSNASGGSCGCWEKLPSLVKPYSPSIEVEWSSVDLRPSGLLHLSFKDPVVQQEFLVYKHRDLITTFTFLIYTIGTPFFILARFSNWGSDDRLLIPGMVAAAGVLISLLLDIVSYSNIDARGESGLSSTLSNSDDEAVEQQQEHHQHHATTALPLNRTKSSFFPQSANSSGGGGSSSKRYLDTGGSSRYTHGGGGVGTANSSGNLHALRLQNQEESSPTMSPRNTVREKNANRRLFITVLGYFFVACTTSFNGTVAYHDSNCRESTDYLDFMNIRTQRNYTAEEVTIFCSRTIPAFSLFTLALALPTQPVSTVLILPNYLVHFFGEIMTHFVQRVTPLEPFEIGVRILMEGTIVIIALGLHVIRHKSSMTSFRKEILLRQTNEVAVQREEEADLLLCNMLPLSILDRLMKGKPTADQTDEATVLMSDIKSFTAWSSSRRAGEVVEMLNVLVSEFDQLATALEVEKVKTIGDAYWAVSGLPDPCTNHAERICNFGCHMLEALALQNTLNPAWGGISIRVGIHSGPLEGGILGSHQMSYEVFGETSKIAAKVEQRGIPNVVLATEDTIWALNLDENQISAYLNQKKNIAGNLLHRPEDASENFGGMKASSPRPGTTGEMHNEPTFGEFTTQNSAGNAEGTEFEYVIYKLPKLLERDVNEWGLHPSDGPGVKESLVAAAEEIKKEEALTRASESSPATTAVPALSATDQTAGSGSFRNLKNRQKSIYFKKPLFGYSTSTNSLPQLTVQGVNDLGASSYSTSGNPAMENAAQATHQQQQQFGAGASQVSSRSQNSRQSGRLSAVGGSRTNSRTSRNRRRSTILALEDSANPPGGSSQQGEDPASSAANNNGIVTLVARAEWSETDAKKRRAEFLALRAAQAGTESSGGRVNLKSLEQKYSDRKYQWLFPEFASPVVEDEFQRRLAEDLQRLRVASRIFLLSLLVSILISIGIAQGSFSAASVTLFSCSGLLGAVDLFLLLFLQGGGSASYIRFVPKIHALFQHGAALLLVIAAGQMPSGSSQATNDVTYLAIPCCIILGFGNLGFISAATLIFANVLIFVPVMIWLISDVLMLSTQIFFLFFAVVCVALTYIVTEKQYRRRFLQEKIAEYFKAKQEERTAEQVAMLRAIVPPHTVAPLMNWMQLGFRPEQSIVHNLPMTAVAFVQLDSGFNNTARVVGAQQSPPSSGQGMIPSPPSAPFAPLGYSAEDRKSGGDLASFLVVPSGAPPRPAITNSSESASGGSASGSAHGSPKETQVSSTRIIVPLPNAVVDEADISEDGGENPIARPNPASNERSTTRPTLVSVPTDFSLGASANELAAQNGSPGGSSLTVTATGAAQYMAVSTLVAGGAVSGDGSRIVNGGGGAEIAAAGTAGVGGNAVLSSALLSNHWLQAVHQSVDEVLAKYSDSGSLIKIKTMGDVLMLAGPFTTQSSYLSDGSVGEFDGEALSSTCREMVTAVLDISRAAAASSDGLPSARASPKSAALGGVGNRTNSGRSFKEGPPPLLGSSTNNRQQHLFNLRAGMHCGELVGAVLGNSRLCYDIFGDTVNTASRVMTSGDMGVVSVSQTFHDCYHTYHLPSPPPRQSSVSSLPTASAAALVGAPTTDGKPPRAPRNNATAVFSEESITVAAKGKGVIEVYRVLKIA